MCFTFSMFTLIQSGRTSGWNRRACEKATLGLSEQVRMCSARFGRCSWNCTYFKGGQQSNRRKVLYVP